MADVEPLAPGTGLCRRRTQRRGRARNRLTARPAPGWVVRSE